MKKNIFFALIMSIAVAATSCSKDPQETVDKTTYTVTILVEGRTAASGATPATAYAALSGATVTLLDYGQTYTTDATGKVKFSIQPGSYRVSVDAKGGYKYITSTGTNPTTPKFGDEEYVILGVSKDAYEVISLEK